ncbi:SWIM zinc finger family protein [halophilic archaeon]|nr:SWIM zinc finger family protein [halophilic archaeon]
MANETHENPDEHQYTVTLDDMTEDTLACTCPHHVYRPAHYTHMAAVEDATDDGILEAFRSEDNETDEDDAESEECDRDGLNSFPCWPCVRTGQKELPN